MNEVCEILSEMNNVTLTFLVVPSRQHHIDSFSNVTGREHGGGTGRQKVVHLKVLHSTHIHISIFVSSLFASIWFYKFETSSS